MLRVAVHSGIQQRHSGARHTLAKTRNSFTDRENEREKVWKLSEVQRARRNAKGMATTTKARKGLQTQG